MLDSFGELKLLEAIEKQGSLAMAADALGMKLSSASRMLARIESEMGFKVLDRRVKPAILTPQATGLLPHVRKILKAHDRMNEVIEVLGKVVKTSPKVLKVSFPINSAREALLAGVEHFKERHPDVSVEVTADAGPSGLLEGRVDVAYFGFNPHHASIFVVQAQAEANLLFASKRYIAEHGSPTCIQDLVHHTVLTRYSDNPTATRELTNGKENYFLRAEQPMLQGDAQFCRAQLLKGKGIALDLGFDFIEAELRRGEVVAILTDWHRPYWDNHVACRVKDQSNPLVRELMALIKEVHDRVVPSHWRHWYEYFGADVRLAVPANRLKQAF